MNTNVVYHNSEEIIKEILQKIQNHDLVFFVGSRISVREPSNLPGVEEIREKTIRALCGEDLNKYFDVNLIFKKMSLIRHEEFLELIYRTVGNVGIEILDCLKEGGPNPNHFFLAQGLGKCFDIIVTTNQDPLIEKALNTIGKNLLRTTRQGDKIFENGIIFKLHGCIEKPKSIITLLRQLIKGLPRSRSRMLSNILENKCLLFTGYSGLDEDIFHVLLNSDFKHIYWNIRPGSEARENVKELYQRHPDKLLLFKYDLDVLFDKLTSELNFRHYALTKTSHPELDQIFSEWVKHIGNERFNVLGQILSNDRVAEYKVALRCFDRTLSLISDEKEKNKLILAKTYYFKGSAYMDYKTFEGEKYQKKAYESYLEATRYYSELGDIEGEANALVGMGESCRHRAKYKEAIRLYKEAREKLVDEKDEECIAAKATLYLADVYRMQDKLDEALEEYRSAYRLLKRKGLIADACWSQIWQGEIYVYKGNYALALRHNRKALEIADKYNFKQYLAWAKYVEIDISKYRGGNVEDLIDETKRINRVFEELKNQNGITWCNEMLAEFYRLKGNYKEAENRTGEISWLCRKYEYKVCLAYIQLNEAEILRAKGQYDAAIEKYKQVLDTKIGDLQRHHAHAILGIAETNRVKGIGSQAEYEKALEMYRYIGMRHGIVHTLIGLVLFTGLRNRDLSPILKRAEDESLKRPKLKKELILIKKLKREYLRNKKDVSNWLHPLEFP